MTKGLNAPAKLSVKKLEASTPLRVFGMVV